MSPRRARRPPRPRGCGPPGGPPKPGPPKARPAGGPAEAGPAEAAARTAPAAHHREQLGEEHPVAARAPVMLLVVAAPVRRCVGGTGHVVLLSVLIYRTNITIYRKCSIVKRRARSDRRAPYAR